MKVQSYTEKDLKGLSDKDHIRLNATGLIVSTDSYGQYHTIKEVLDNSIDEVSILPDSHVDVYFFQDLKKNTYQTVVIDTGRGFPLGKVYQAVTELKFSGKFTTDAYKTSSGMFGYGLKVATNLAKRYRVITHRDNEVVAIDNLDDSPLPTEDRRPYPSPATGTVVVLDVLDELFTEVDKFTREGYNRIIHFLQILSIFSPTTPANPLHQKYRFFLHNKPIDEAFWTTDPVTAATFIQNTYEHSAAKIYDSLEASNSDSFLAQLWGLDSSTTFVWKDENRFKQDMHPTEDLVDPRNPSKGYVEMGYDIRLYIPKILRPGKCLSLVNNVVIRNQSSTHIVAMHKVLKEKLRELIKDEAIQKYFDEYYELPIYSAMSILYQGAKFSGYTKDGFISAKFEKAFTAKLYEQMEELSEHYWISIFEVIYKDIEVSYLKFYNKPISTAKMRDKMLDIEVTFVDCDTPDRSEAELFIVEGTSAGGMKNSRSPEIHAVMMMRGKPLNVIIDEHSTAKSIEKLRSYKAYADLMTILNVQPGQTDLSGCRYGKIIISTDADSDGYHIAASHTGALYTINPQLLASGMVYIANPPLYEVWAGNAAARRKVAKKILLRDKHGLLGFRSSIYDKCLNIYYRYKGDTGTPKLITNDTSEQLFTGLCVAITELGDHISEYAEQYTVPADYLERLAMVTYALDPYDPNIAVLEHILGTRVHYIPSYKTIRIEALPQDVVISLPTFRQQLYDSVLPLLRQYAWDKTELYVSTKETDALQMRPMTYMQLYNVFKELDSGFTVKRHKGLGAMGDAEVSAAFMNESSRRLKRITSLGDVDVIYGLLGVKVDMRKQLMIEQGMTSY